MKSTILSRFRDRITVSILYISLISILVPIYYYQIEIPFYQSAGLYLPFISLYLLYILKKYKKIVIVRNILISLAFIVQIYLLMTSSEDINKMFFIPISIFIFYSLLEIKRAIWVTTILLLLIIFHQFQFGTNLSKYEFYAIIVSTIMTSFAFASLSLLVRKLSNQSNSLFKKLKIINKELSQKVIKKTKEIKLSNKILNSILNSHDDIVILLNQTDTVISNDKYNAYFIDQPYTIFELLEKNEIDINSSTILQSHKISHNGFTFLLTKKPINIENEVYTLISLTDISEFNNHVQQLKQQAHVDNLTSLNNRVIFEQIVNDLVTLAEQHKTTFSLIMFDIDDFKTVNDNYGHDEGDKVLQEVAEFVKTHIRSNDLLFRWGGDEFFLIVKGVDSLHAYDISEKIRNAFLDTLTAKQYGITISFGITIYKPTDTIQTITKRVDNALYQSKHSGKNRSTIL